MKFSEYIFERRMRSYNQSLLFHYFSAILIYIGAILVSVLLILILQMLNLIYFNVDLFGLLLTTPIFVIYYRPGEKSVFNFVGKDIFRGVLWGLIPLLVIYGIVSTFLDFSFSAGKISPSMIFYVSALFCASFLEEYFFRYILLNIAEKKGKLMTGIFVSSLLWGIAHMKPPVSFNMVMGVLNIFTLGIVLSFVYLETKNLTLLTFFHFTWNFFVSIVFGQTLSGIKGMPSFLHFEFLKSPDSSGLFTGGSFGIEGSIVTTFIISTLLFYLYITRYGLYNNVDKKI